MPLNQKVAPRSLVFAVLLKNLHPLSLFITFLFYLFINVFDLGMDLGINMSKKNIIRFANKSRF